MRVIERKASAVRAPSGAPDQAAYSFDAGSRIETPLSETAKARRVCHRDTRHTDGAQLLILEAGATWNPGAGCYNSRRCFVGFCGFGEVVVAPRNAPDAKDADDGHVRLVITGSRVPQWNRRRFQHARADAHEGVRAGTRTERRVTQGESAR